MSDPTSGQPSRRGSPKRPGSVTGAVVIAIGFLVLELLGSLFLLLVDFASDAPPVVTYSIAALNLLLAVLLAWGTVAALRGRTNKLLVLAASAVLVVNALPIIFFVANRTFNIGVAPSVMAVFGGAAIIGLVTTSSSRNFFHARGGTVW